MTDCKRLERTSNLVPMPFGPGLCEEPLEECNHPDVTDEESDDCALGTPCKHYEKDDYVEQDYYVEHPGNLLVAFLRRLVLATYPRLTRGKLSDEDSHNE